MKMLIKKKPQVVSIVAGHATYVVVYVVIFAVVVVCLCTSLASTAAKSVHGFFAQVLRLDNKKK